MPFANSILFCAGEYYLNEAKGILRGGAAPKLKLKNIGKNDYIMFNP